MWGARRSTTGIAPAARKPGAVATTSRQLLCALQRRFLELAPSMSTRDITTAASCLLGLRALPSAADRIISLRLRNCLLEDCRVASQTQTLGVPLQYPFATLRSVFAILVLLDTRDLRTLDACSYLVSNYFIAEVSALQPPVRRFRFVEDILKACKKLRYINPTLVEALRGAAHIPSPPRTSSTPSEAAAGVVTVPAALGELFVYFEEAAAGVAVPTSVAKSLNGAPSSCGTADVSAAPAVAAATPYDPVALSLTAAVDEAAAVLAALDDRLEVDQRVISQILGRRAEAMRSVMSQLSTSPSRVSPVDAARSVVSLVSKLCMIAERQRVAGRDGDAGQQLLEFVSAAAPLMTKPQLRATSNWLRQQGKVGEAPQCNALRVAADTVLRRVEQLLAQSRAPASSSSSSSSVANGVAPFTLRECVSFLHLAAVVGVANEADRGNTRDTLISSLLATATSPDAKPARQLGPLLELAKVVHGSLRLSHRESQHQLLLIGEVLCDIPGAALRNEMRQSSKRRPRAGAATAALPESADSPELTAMRRSLALVLLLASRGAMSKKVAIALAPFLLEGYDALEHRTPGDGAASDAPDARMAIAALRRGGQLHDAAVAGPIVAPLALMYLQRCPGTAGAGADSGGGGGTPWEWSGRQQAVLCADAQEKALLVRLLEEQRVGSGGVWSIRYGSVVASLRSRETPF